jgi:hypothetical protein
MYSVQPKGEYKMTTQTMRPSDNFLITTTVMGSLLCVAVIGLAMWLTALWTSDEVSYTLTLAMGHAVFLNAYEAFALDWFIGRFTIPFDFVVWVLRCFHAI